MQYQRFCYLGIYLPQKMHLLTVRPSRQSVKEMTRQW